MPRDQRARRTYGVTLVRGPFVELARHPGACSDAKELLSRKASYKRPLAADLFCGAGGLSLGLQAAGFDVIIGIDHDQLALATHANLFPGLALDRDLSEPESVEEISELLSACDVSLIAGGPPCQPFSRAGSSKIRSLVEAGLREAHDRRRDLWEAWLEIVLRVQPPAVLLENVPEMAIGGDMEILRTLVDSLEREGYAVHTRILKAVEHGVPQFRQRLFLVALADHGAFEWPRTVARMSTVSDAIADLPPVEGGWRPPGGAAGYIAYSKPPNANPFVKRARTGMAGTMAARLYDHITRPVRPDDRLIFEQMDPKTKYSDLDDGPHKRYRDDIFDDKYKRLGWEEPSRSITAHIAKDGYWYIHPAQPRTLTIREAARIQTFPDRVRFSGPPSAAFRQIGNAVPPLLAERVGRQILMRKPKASVAPVTTEVSSALAAWFTLRDELAVPWLDATSEWQVIAAELLLARCPAKRAREAWTTLQKHEDPSITVELADDLRFLGDSLDRSHRAERVIAAAAWYETSAEPFASVDTMARNPFVPRHTAELAALVAGTTPLGPILSTAPILRTAARWAGQPVDKVDKGTAGRMVVARMVGGSVYDPDSTDTRLAQAALVELSHSICRPARPRCEVCPLTASCVYRARLDRHRARVR